MTANATGEMSRRRLKWYQCSLGTVAGFLAILVLMAFLAWEAMGPDTRNLARDGAKAQVGIMAESVKKYKETVGRYPPDLNALIAAPAELPQGKWAGPYLHKLWQLDPWGHPYQYLQPGKHNPNGFDLWTVSPDGKEIGNWNID